ncbi:hypothetical protein GJ496_007675 [Pomphorhynchus laevis]|nr:hypothetical protein GJ496_007675 [Pomphorhynchus laevis]
MSRGELSSEQQCATNMLYNIKRVAVQIKTFIALMVGTKISVIKGYCNIRQRGKELNKLNKFCWKWNLGEPSRIVVRNLCAFPTQLALYGAAICDSRVRNSIDASHYNHNVVLTL